MSTSPTAYPAFDPEEYLELSKELAGRSDSASLRSAADRAYYAAFIVSRNELRDKGYFTPIDGTEDHKKVSELLRRPEILGTFGNEEMRLREHRNRVTYRVGNVGMPSPMRMIDTAVKIISLVKALPARTKPK